MKSIMLRALFALIVTFCCAAMAAAQQIPDNPPPAQGGQIDNLDGQADPPVQGGAVDQIRDPEVQQKLDRIQELERESAQADKVLATETRPAVRGQAINDSCNAKQEIGRLRQELSALRGRQARTDGKVRNLQSSDKGQNERLNKIDDTVFGAKDKDGKRTGGTVKSVKDLESWRQKLIAENGDLWWIAANRGEIDKATAITPDAAAFFAAAKEAGYDDGSGRFNAGKFLGVLKDHEDRLRQVEGNSWVSWLGIALALLVTLAVVFGGIYLLGLIKSLAGKAFIEHVDLESRVDNEVGSIKSRLDVLESAAGIIPPVPAPAPAPVTPAPAPITDPVINSMSISTGTTGDAFVLDGVFDGTESVVFIDDFSLTPYPATVTVTATQITGTVPDVYGITGPFSVVATNRAGRNSAPVAFNMN